MGGVTSWAQTIATIVTVLGAFGAMGLWLLRALDRRIAVQVGDLGLLLTTRIDGVEQSLTARINDVEQASIARDVSLERSLTGTMDRRFAEMDARFDRLETRLDALDRLTDTRLSAVEADMHLVKQHLLSQPAA